LQGKYTQNRVTYKENHKSLYDDTALFFKAIKDMQSEGFAFETHDTIDGDHGRIETRKYVMTSDIGWL
jgi:hypothetical protein